MKRFIFIFITALASIIGANAQQKPTIAQSFAWTPMAPLGLHEPATIDTIFTDYHLQAVPSAVSDAWACTGNMGAEGINMIASERRSISDFFFRDALRTWLPSNDNLIFYNTRLPMTLLSYNTGGARDNAQDRLKGIFSGNVNSKLQVGAMLDYIYSKGSYANQATKDMIWGLSGSYMGDRWELQTAYSHVNMLNKENGGITNDLYIIDPAQLQGGVSSIDPKSIPTRLSNAHTRYVGSNLYLNNRYKVGYWHEEMLEGDTVPSRTYIPVTSFVWTLEYTDGKHIFSDDAPGEIRSFFGNTYLDNKRTFDRTTYFALSNTLGISMLEGFNKNIKFGLSAYARHQLRRYNQTPDSIDHFAPDLDLTPWPEGYKGVEPRATQNLLWVGGQLTKQHGSILTYDATAEIGIAGPAAGDLKLLGNIATRIPLFGDTVKVNGYVNFANIAAPYLINNYVSNHFVWHNDFGKERTLKFGGRLDVPFSNTAIEVEAQNLQNLLYFDASCLPQQHGGSVQVFSARLTQKLHFGILHWDNRITYQTSSNDEVLPLPNLAVYSNLYLRFRIATLRVQLGVDCDYYTKYYGVSYQPATATFFNQREQKIGNFAFMNLYADMKLSKTRFYVMMSHINQGWFGNDYFSMPHYPLNPRRFQIGLSIDFAN